MLNLPQRIVRGEKETTFIIMRLKGTLKFHLQNSFAIINTDLIFRWYFRKITSKVVTSSYRERGRKNVKRMVHFSVIQILA